MSRNKLSSFGNGFFSTAKSPNSPVRNLSVNGGNKVSSKACSVNGQAVAYKFSIEETCMVAMEFATVIIDDSAAMKSAITVSTATTGGVNLVYIGEESENNSLLFCNNISTVARNNLFGGSFSGDLNQVDNTTTLMSESMITVSNSMATIQVSSIENL